VVDEDVVKVHEAVAGLVRDGKPLRVSIGRHPQQPDVFIIEPKPPIAVLDLKEVQDLDVGKLGILVSERINEAGWWPA
jgi:hypothetical protein